MKSFLYESIDNQTETGSSAFLFDLRNATKITRMVSRDERLEKHIDFMMRLHEHVYKSLYENCYPTNFAFNDTGDGYLCLFWDEIHALTCLRQAIYVQEFLQETLERHNETLKLQGPMDKFNYGIGLHSGGSTIKRSSYNTLGISIKKDFIFGIVVNTVKRLESFTKNFTESNFLVTGNYKDAFLSQAPSDILKSLFEEGSPYLRQSPGRADLKDGKESGHLIYALKQDFIDRFRESFKAGPKNTG